MPITKLDTVIKKAASDRIIRGSEATAIIREAKKSGSTRPITDVFAAIDRTRASIDAKATRLICGNLEQKMTRAEWIHFAQKCASPSGVWGPGGDGAKKVSRAELPPAVKKVFDRWQASDAEDKVNVVTFTVAGKPAYLMNQYSEFGTSFGLFDQAGKSLDLKEDSENVKRETARVQGTFDKYFRSPEMKAWRDAVEHTDIGVLSDYRKVSTALDASKIAALPAEVKTVLADMKKDVKKDLRLEVFRNKSDGSLLAIVQQSYTGPEHFAHFSKSGTLKQRFTIDL